MLALHQQISAMKSITVPEFPPKKLFFNTEEDFVQTRKAALQNYFNTLLAHVSVDDIPQLQQFLVRGESRQIQSKSELGGSEVIQQQQSFQQSKLTSQFNSSQQIQSQQQQPKNKLNKIPKSTYDKITNETNQKFIDLAFMISPPEDGDIKKKKLLYDQVKLDMKLIDTKKEPIQINPEAILLIANETFETTNRTFFNNLQLLQTKISQILEEK